MAALPSIPTFLDDTAPTMADLQALSYAVKFTSDMTVRPAWHFYKTSTFALTASTWNSPQYSTVAYDNDGVQSSGVAKIVTQGYYAVEACFDIGPTSSEITFLGTFLWTAGPSNPHFTSGTTLQFGPRGGGVNSENIADSALCITDICPNVCYPGDTIQPQVYVSAAATLQVNSNGSYHNGRFVANFTGCYVAMGS